MRISDWSSDVCSSDLKTAVRRCRGSAPSFRRAVPPSTGASPHSLPSTPNSCPSALHPHFVMPPRRDGPRSEEHTSELQSLMRTSYAVFCLKKKNKTPSPLIKPLKHPTYDSTSTNSSLRA